MMNTVKEIISTDIELNRSELADQLDDLSTKLRNGEITAFAFTSTHRENDLDVVVNCGFVGTNPHRHNPEGGRYRTETFKCADQGSFEGIFTRFLEDLNLVTSRETDGDIASVGIGYPDPDSGFLDIAIEHGDGDE